MQQALSPRESVPVVGTGFSWGEAKVTISPVERPGWFLRTKADGDVQITSEMMRLGRFHHTYLKSNEYVLRIVEHLFALRQGAMVDGIAIRRESVKLPYDGSANIFWKAIAPHLEKKTALEPYYASSTTRQSPTRPLVTSNREVIGRFVEYRPTKAKDLRVRVRMNYGKYVVFDFAFPRDFEQAVSARHRGRKNLYRVAKIASRFGWKHFDEIAWEHHTDPDELLKEEARHRALDLLGDFAFVAPPGTYLAGEFDSVFAGHRDDFELLPLLRAVGSAADECRWRFSLFVNCVSIDSLQAAFG